jgi:hypothetical protein
MSVVFNPFTGNLDFNDTTKAAGSDTQVQFNDSGKLGGDSGLVFNKTTNKLTAGGDVELNDGGTFTTTLQTVTATANRTISFPDATGTVGLIAGSNQQVIFNSAGAYAGVSTMTFDGTSVTLAGRLINSYTSLASSPAKVFTGTWFTGGTATTTKPHFLIEPSGATSTAWSTSGTGLGVNAASGFAGNLLDLQTNGSKRFAIDQNGFITAGGANQLLAPRSTGTGFRVGGDVVGLGNYGFLVANNSTSSGFSWGDDPNNPTITLSILRDASDTLAQRRTTNAQTFRVYNTFTDASNYERGFLRWSSNVFEVGPEAAGTGTARPMRITAATLKLPNLPTYADNAAATTGGLVAGDVYKTSTGELRITV